MREECGEMNNVQSWSVLSNPEVFLPENQISRYWGSTQGKSKK